MASDLDGSCYLSNAFVDQHATVVLRVVGLFAILVSSALGIFFPLITSSRNLQTTTFLGTCFAAGIVLATAFIHIIPDGDAAFKNPCLGLSGTYPWASAVAGASVLFMFTTEYFLRQYLRRRLGLDDDDVLSHSHGMAETPPPTTATSSSDDSAKALEAGIITPRDARSDKNSLLAQQENNISVMMLESGIIFHSIFVGIDLGITTDVSTARALIIVLAFHQGFEGLALGSALVRAGCNRGKFLLLALAFILITPIGIAIGLGMGSTYNDNGKAALAVKGAFNSVSGGILIYNGLVDLIVPIFTFNNLLKGRAGLQVAAIVLLITGYLAMALLGKWA